MRLSFVNLVLLMALQKVTSLQQSINRRQVLIQGTGLVVFGPIHTTWAADGDLHFENRDRKNNKDALIREDYWYQTGKLPPRLLTTSLRGDDPSWNAFGSCESADGGNPCTYVSLKQRAPAYSKYGYTIADGAREYEQLGKILRDTNPSWGDALALIRKDLGAATVDAELKMILLATALLVSPNFPTPNKELLVARFYANEVHYAHDKLRESIEARNREQALLAWEFGKDAWNSYFQVVNRSINSKVGDQFSPIP